ncbi:MAG: hypothetical protein KA984_03025, partial [Candidatus Cloacimonetes bacterium]|nr:hypothetical protein [Candidatus Cloacimonadota bacterium]
MNRMKLFVITLLAIAPLCLIAQNNMPLLTMMEGEFPGAALGHSICSMDFNGDGLKDLVALEKHWNPNDTLHMSQQFGRIRFYWGGTAFDNEAD